MYRPHTWPASTSPAATPAEIWTSDIDPTSRSAPSRSCTSRTYPWNSIRASSDPQPATEATLETSRSPATAAATLAACTNTPLPELSSTASPSSSFSAWRKGSCGYVVTT